MSFNLRGAVLANVSGNTQDQLQETIVDAIQSGEEKMLPGLGVLFEVIWKNADENEKHEMLETLEQGLKKNKSFENHLKHFYFTNATRWSTMFKIHLNRSIFFIDTIR